MFDGIIFAREGENCSCTEPPVLKIIATRCQILRLKCPVWFPGLVEYIGATSFPNSGLEFCVYCIRFSCLSLLSCAELCTFLCPLVLFTVVISFGSKGFPYKNQIEESFIVVVSCMSPNINIVN